MEFVICSVNRSHENINPQEIVDNDMKSTSLFDRLKTLQQELYYLLQDEFMAMGMSDFPAQDIDFLRQRIRAHMDEIRQIGTILAKAEYLGKKQWLPVTPDEIFDLAFIGKVRNIVQQMVENPEYFLFMQTKLNAVKKAMISDQQMIDKAMNSLQTGMAKMIPWHEEIMAKHVSTFVNLLKTHKRVYDKIKTRMETACMIIIQNIETQKIHELYGNTWFQTKTTHIHVEWWDKNTQIPVRN